jgi:hypothetical protein
MRCPFLHFVTPCHDPSRHDHNTSLLIGMLVRRTRQSQKSDSLERFGRSGVTHLPAEG